MKKNRLTLTVKRGKTKLVDNPFGLGISLQYKFIFDWHLLTEAVQTARGRGSHRTPIFFYLSVVAFILAAILPIVGQSFRSAALSSERLSLFILGLVIISQIVLAMWGIWRNQKNQEASS